MLNLDLTRLPWKMKGWWPNEWLWGSSMETNELFIGETDWLEANVPCSVYTVLHQAGVIPDPMIGLNSRLCEWVCTRDWMFECEFELEEAARSEKTQVLTFQGADYHAHYYLNGTKLGETIGLYANASFDVKDQLKKDEKNRLVVVLAAAPEGIGQIGHTHGVNHLKPRFSYKWDFTARLIELGIWKGIELRSYSDLIIDDVHTRSELHWGSNDSCIMAEIRAAIAIRRVKGGLLDSNIQAVIGIHGEIIDSVRLLPLVFEEAQTTTVEAILQVPNPKLWWPNGMGEQPDYQLSISLLDEEGTVLDERTVAIGIRTIEFNHGDQGVNGSLPYFCRVNRRTMPIKGWNWVPLAHTYCDPHDNKYDWLAYLLKMANVNMIRIWGGGLAERERLYEWCDKYGILVWQDMLQSSSGISNWTSHDPTFLHLLEETMASVIKEKRNHPSLALWCGGNELLNEAFVPLDDSDANLAALKLVVNRLDEGRHFLPTSPSGPRFEISVESLGKGVHHDIHGPWKYLGSIDHYRHSNTSDAQLSSEIGIDGLANLSTIEKIIPSQYRMPATRANRYWAHHGGSWWDHSDRSRTLFGITEDLRDEVYASQMIQAEGLRYAVEETRRQRERNAGILLWQFNEPFPNATCTSSVDYYNRPKMAYHAVASAYKPIHASLRYDRLNWSGFSNFVGECFVHNDTDILLEGRLVVEAINQYGNKTVLIAVDVKADPFSTRYVSHISIKLVQFPDEILWVRLTLGWGNGTDINLYSYSTAEKQPFHSLIKMPRTRLDWNVIRLSELEWSVEVTNQGSVAALFVNLVIDEVQLDYVVLNDFRTLFPEETASYIIRFGQAIDFPCNRQLLRVTCWNDARITSMAVKGKTAENTAPESETTM